jgi:hypothetical protein
MDEVGCKVNMETPQHEIALHIHPNTISIGFGSIQVTDASVPAENACRGPRACFWPSDRKLPDTPNHSFK